MKICDFTLPELEQITANANFTKEEYALFDMRAKDIPLEECAEKMNVSIATIYRINKKIKNKVTKLIVK